MTDHIKTQEEITQEELLSNSNKYLNKKKQNIISSMKWQKTKRDNKDPLYMEQCRINAKKYYEKNKEKINSNNKLYYENNKERIKEYNKRYTEEHKEQLKEYNKQYQTRLKQHKQSLIDSI